MWEESVRSLEDPVAELLRRGEDPEAIRSVLLAHGLSPEAVESLLKRSVGNQPWKSAISHVRVAVAFTLSAVLLVGMTLAGATVGVWAGWSPLLGEHCGLAVIPAIGFAGLCGLLGWSLDLGWGLPRPPPC
jgi:hypothetical protein